MNDSDLLMRAFTIRIIFVAMMNAWPAALLLALPAACSAPAPRQEETSSTRADEIARAIRENRPWKTPEEAEKDCIYLAEHAGKKHLDALLKVIEREDSAPALAAILAAARLIGPSEEPWIENALASQDATKRMRVLLLLRESRLAEARPLLARHAKTLLDPRRKDVAGVALGAMSACGAREATPDIMDYFFSTDGDGAALRALGKIWDCSAQAPALPREEERFRLRVQLTAHRLAMGPASTAESAEAMVRVMTLAELDDFLNKQAGEVFPARGFIAAAAARPDFDAVKGRRIHEALLASPDETLAARILWGSPHELDPKAVRSLLEDERSVRTDGLPRARMCDFAAARLTAQTDKTKVDIPAEPERREEILKKWRAAAGR
ncbi:MAG: hypothetical protein HY716_00145 [Planctomycetes bacterium]|nr:hypothetical protein [Planctomycetota bacterium]